MVEVVGGPCCVRKEVVAFDEYYPIPGLVGVVVVGCHPSPKKNP